MDMFPFVFKSFYISYYKDYLLLFYKNMLIKLLNIIITVKLFNNI